MERYLTSVGRNSNLLMGMSISPRGHFEDREQFVKFGKRIRELYASPAVSCRGVGTSFTLSLERPELIRNLVVMEDIHYGERVRKFSVLIETPNGIERLFEAQCIGHKRIIPVNRPIQGVRLLIKDAVGQPVIKDMTLYR